MMTLAEAGASYTPGQLASFLGIAAFLLGLVVLSRKVFGHDPALHKEYASKDEHNALKKEVEKIDSERRVSVANLHAKIDGNTAITSATGAKVDQMNLQLQQLNTHLLTLKK